MKAISVGFLVVTLMLFFILSGCGGGGWQTAQPPTQAPTQTPTTTPSPAPERKDVPLYKNLFEGSLDQALDGLSSGNNQVRVNTENVDHQSGLQSLEVCGEMPGPIYSSLNVTFWMEPLIGESTIDLSNKTVGFLFYVPEDSPIDLVSLVAMSTLGQVSLFGASLGEGGISKGEWHSIQVDIQPIYENGTWAWSDLSPEDSRSAIQYTNAVMITGMRSSEGQAAETSFLIDSFKWIGNDISWRPALDPAAATMRNYADARGLKVSSVVFNTTFNNNFNDPWYRYTLATQMNFTTAYVGVPPEEKPAVFSAMEFDYSPGDEVAAFAEANGMLLEGATGGWHADNPRWITDGTYDELKAYLDRKIEADISHYGGKVLYWGIFNEVLDSDGVSFHNRQKKDPYDVLYGTEWAPYGGRYSPYVDGNDTSLIEFAFTKAKLVDPKAKYYLNDYMVEEIGTPRSEFFFNFVKGMKDRGIPIEGVGMQLHLIYPNSPAPGSTNMLADVPAYLNRVDRNVKRYAAAGLFVSVTEFECQVRLDDIDLTTQAGKDEYSRRQQVQAEIYIGMMKIVRDNPNMDFFRFWMLSDQPMTSAYDWSGSETAQDLHGFRFTDSFLFDRNYEPKPAFFAALDVLKPK
jgi:endo-1,4-beta-xylanase